MWLKLIKVVRDYFLVSHKEAQGVTVLLILSVGVVTATTVYKSLPTGHDFTPKVVTAEAKGIVEQITAPKSIKEVEHTTPPSKNSSNPIPKPIAKIDIATADSAALTAIKGIGPVLAARIIRFRTKLGGFHSIDQIRDVYGISPDYLSTILSSVTISSTEVKQIDLNNASFKVFVHHPYLQYEDVKKIFEHKQTTGGYNMVIDLQNHQILPDSVYKKIEPYLTI